PDLGWHQADPRGCLQAAVLQTDQTAMKPLEISLSVRAQPRECSRSVLGRRIFHTQDLPKFQDLAPSQLQQVPEGGCPPVAGLWRYFGGRRGKDTQGAGIVGHDRVVLSDNGRPA